MVEIWFAVGVNTFARNFEKTLALFQKVLLKPCCDEEQYLLNKYAQ